MAIHPAKERLSIYSWGHFSDLETVYMILVGDEVDQTRNQRKVCQVLRPSRVGSGLLVEP